ncbi:hypothetical protein BJ741DRAFT_591513 [Chytriomyces cf. hyalinus JEL632]|nr:hypothetical protein BJ741DRAFT_591513 [Chytriomyces cf. hyalinus JEL632]
MAPHEQHPLLPLNLTPVNRRRGCALDRRFVLILAVFVLFKLSGLSLWNYNYTRTGVAKPSSYFNSVSVWSEGSGSTSTAVSVASSNNAQINYIIEADSYLAMEQTVVDASVEPVSNTLAVSVKFPENYHGRIQASLQIALPASLLNFTLVEGSGSFVYDGPNVSKGFSATLGSGSVKIKSSLSPTDMRLKSGSGSIHTFSTIDSTSFFALSGSGSVTLAEKVVASDVQVESGSGSVKAAGIHGYTKTKIITHSGSLKAGLYPGVEEATALLQSGSGSVQVEAVGFKGRFTALTGSGHIVVSGEDTSTLKTSASGRVGGPDGHGIMDAKAGSGSIRLTFS